MLAACLAAAPGPADAGAGAQEAKRRIGLAGYQLVLSERIARAACYHAMGIAAQRHAEMLVTARGDFGAGIDALLDGSARHGIGPAADPRVRAALGKLAAIWAGYESALSAAATDRQALADLDMHVLPVLVASDRVARAIRSSDGVAAVPDDLAQAINLAGWQRMLTQRAAKEYCLIAAGVDPASNRAALAETVALFDRHLDGLIEGSDALRLMPAPDETLVAQFREVAALWQPLRARFLEAAGGTTPGHDDLSAVAASVDAVLRSAEDALWIYETL